MFNNNINNQENRKENEFKCINTLIAGHGLIRCYESQYRGDYLLFYK